MCMHILECDGITVLWCSKHSWVALALVSVACASPSGIKLNMLDTAGFVTAVNHGAEARLMRVEDETKMLHSEVEHLKT